MAGGFFLFMRFLFHFPAPRAGGCHISFVVECVPCGIQCFRREGTGEAAADDVGGIHNEEEGVGVYIFDEVAQFGDLRQIYDGEDDLLIFAAESALAVEQCGAVMDIS